MIGDNDSEEIRRVTIMMMLRFPQGVVFFCLFMILWGIAIAIIVSIECYHLMGSMYAYLHFVECLIVKI